MPTFNWIVNSSKLPWLELDIDFPFEKMYEEEKSNRLKICL